MAAKYALTTSLVPAGDGGAVAVGGTITVTVGGDDVTVEGEDGTVVPVDVTVEGDGGRGGAAPLAGFPPTVGRFPPLDPVRLDTPKYTPPPTSITSSAAPAIVSHDRWDGSGAESFGGGVTAS
jgi:hypothetical protein